MKVAYFSPMPPDRSGIADYSALLVPALARLVEVEVVRPGRTRPLADADVALYHVGNDPDAHGWIVDALRRQAGVVVLHDFVIHHLVAGITIGRKDGHAYLAALERDAGVAGRLLGWGVLEGRVPPLWEVRPEEFPLAGEVLDAATGVIVHSRYVEEGVREHGYDGPVWRIPHPAWPVAAVVPAELGGSPLLGSFGHLNESKRIPQLLAAFAALRAQRPEARLLLVGSEAPGFDLAGRLERLGLAVDRVVRQPYVEEQRLWSLLEACDACVLLRAPTMGETSGSAIRALSLGKPLVVSDVGWFSELPDEVALKVPAGEGEIPALSAALEQLALPEVARRMGEAARAYAAREHDLGRAAERYAAALEEAAGGAAVERKVLHEVARAAAESGTEPAFVAPSLEELGLAGANGRGPAGRVSQPGSGTRLLGVPPVWVWVVSLYAVSVVVQVALGLRVVSPWIMVDELIYSDIARSIAATGHFAVRGVHADYGVVYPLLLSSVYKAFGPMTEVYRWARVLNAVALCSVVFPTYLLARRVVRPTAALAAAALTVAVPPMVFAGTLMTENAFYPIFVWLAFALVAALERPSFRRQLAVLVLCALAFLTRAQAVALIGAVLCAPLVLAWIERGRPRRLGAWKPLYGLTGAAVLAAVVVEEARGRSVSHLLGGYSGTSGATYRVWPAIEWTAFHLAGLDLSLFVAPFAALIVLVANARHLDRALRVFSAAAVSLVVLLTVEVGVFASHYSERIEERNLFYLAPLFLIALLAWIERGQPRPPRAAFAAAAAAAALPGTIPFLNLLNINAQSDTMFVQPWWYLGDRVAGMSSVQLLVVVVSVALGAAFLWLPRGWAPVLPALVALGFLLTWLPLQVWVHSFPRLSSGAYLNGISRPQHSWIDDAVGRNADVSVLWTGNDEFRVWENEFWNRSVRRVYSLGTGLRGGMPETPLQVRPASGVLVDPHGKRIDARYVLADGSASVLGTPVASDAGRNMVLYRVTPPLRIGIRITGWYADTWTAHRASWTNVRCADGFLAMRLSSDAKLFPGVIQRISITGTTPTRTVLLPTTQERTLLLPLTPRRGICRVVLTVTPSRVPNDFPRLHLGPDPRLLGVRVDHFEYLPPR